MTYPVILKCTSSRGRAANKYFCCFFLHYSYISELDALVDSIHICGIKLSLLESHPNQTQQSTIATELSKCAPITISKSLTNKSQVSNLSKKSFQRVKKLLLQYHKLEPCV